LVTYIKFKDRRSTKQ